ncbi:tetratricopeptide repeat protein [Kitasatospora sp. NPDC004615]|uniref:tetratricopeptide repeat protein n=1 Tax=Kitasatospora sp. NPDC004615 TaxID=3364017 RepID=UPI003680E9C1
MSRAEALRRRVDSQFVGRRAQLALFADNLRKNPDPEAGPDPADFLFHVRGVGGIGKSTLIAQWRETAGRAGGRTALIDDTDVQGVDTALAALAAQLASPEAPFKDFDKALEQYRRAQATPADLPSLPARVVAHAALGAANTFVPGSAAFTTPETVAESTDRLIAAVRRRRPTGDSELATLSRAFVTELAHLCDREPVPWVVLFLDTWEITGRHLDGWLRELIDGTYGDLPLDVIVVLAGRDELAERDWARLRSAVVDVALEAFTEQEARDLLASRGVHSPDAIDAIVRMSLGLPLLLALLAGTDPHSAEEVADAGTDAVDKAVQRFLQWIPEPALRETVLAAALPPRLDRDLFCLAVDDPTAPGWDWLLDQPFVTAHGDAHQYHAVVRASLLRHHRIRAPHAWRGGHARLAEHHAAACEALQAELPPSRLRSNARWLRHLLDETYHLLCAAPTTQLPPALHRLAEAADHSPDSLTAWAELLTLAARDTADADLTRWSELLHTALTTPDPAETVLTALAAPGLPARLRARALTGQGHRSIQQNEDPAALVLLDQALLLAPDLLPALIQRGRVRCYLGHRDLALADLDAALARTPFAAEVLAAREHPDRLAAAVSDRATTVATRQEHSDAFYYRGWVLRLVGRLDEALADLDAAVVLDPEDSWALSERGQVHHTAGRFDRAIADFTAALALEPEHGSALIRRGLAQGAAHRIDLAIGDFDAALALDPFNAWALCERGIAHRLADRPEQAISDFTAALSVNPGYVWALGERGKTHYQSGRLSHAVADLDAALALDPDNPVVLRDRGETHSRAGRYGQAVADFTAAIALNPNDFIALVWRGRTHCREGHLDLALVDLDAALAINPADPWAHFYRGEIHQDATRHPEAIADFSAAVAIDPQHIWALLHRAKSHRRTGCPDQASADLDAALAIDPGFHWALLERAHLHRQTGRHDLALTDFDAALTIEPDSPWLLRDRAELHRRAGRLDAAVTDLRASLALSPYEIGTHCALVAVLRRQGKWQPAREALDQAARLEPTAPGVLREEAVTQLYEHGREASTPAWDALLAAVPPTLATSRAALAVLHAVAVQDGELGPPIAEFLAVPNAPDTHDTLREYLHELTTSPAAARAAAALGLLGQAP